ARQLQPETRLEVAAGHGVEWLTRRFQHFGYERWGDTRNSGAGRRRGAEGRPLDTCSLACRLGWVGAPANRWGRKAAGSGRVPRAGDLLRDPIGCRFGGMIRRSDQQTRAQRGGTRRQRLPGWIHPGPILRPTRRWVATNRIRGLRPSLMGA